MTNKKGRLFGAALFLWLLSGCAQLRTDMITPQVTVMEFELMEVGLFSATAEIGLLVDNPNPFGFTAKGLSYRVLLGGTQIADTRSDRKLEIPASGQKLVRIPITFSYTGLMQGLQTMIDRQELSYEVTGKVYTQWMDFPFSKTDTLSMPQTQPSGR